MNVRLKVWVGSTFTADPCQRITSPNLMPSLHAPSPPIHTHPLKISYHGNSSSVIAQRDIVRCTILTFDQFKDVAVQASVAMCTVIIAYAHKSRPLSEV